MDTNFLHDLERLEDQIFHYKPSIKSAEKKSYVRNRLQSQLLHSKAVVEIQRMDVECESLMVSLKQRLMQLQDFLIPKTNEQIMPKKQLALKNNDDLTLNLSAESGDEDDTSEIISSEKNEKNVKCLKDKQTVETQQADTSETPIDCLPLALRRQPRERRLSYKSFSSSSTSHSRTSKKKVHRQEQTVTTSGVSFSSEEIVVEREVDTTPTIHIKIPSLHRGNVHYIILDSLNFARKVFDYRANEVKQKREQKSILHSSKAFKSQNKTIKSSGTAALQQEHDMELSQLIQDVMAEASSDETLQATSALESINNNLIDNYEFVENDSFVNCSQSSQEFSFSQNSNLLEPICGTSNVSNTRKKQRKNAKRSNEMKQNEPPKKRGRKPKQKNNSETVQSQPPTKSNLAQYVELFSNDCDLLAGSTTPAASSTKSQHLVSSTTHNYEVVDQLQQQQEQQTPSEPITYYIDGDWANGGPCQLITSNTLAIEERRNNTNENAPFQDFVNYIDNGGNSSNDVMATVLGCNHSLPVSIPRSIANFAFQNKNPHHQVIQPTHQPSAIQNSFLPIINIQIPPLPNNITSTEPPPAHTHKEIVDLSIKPASGSTTVHVESLKNFDNSSLGVDDDCMPLDLSTCGKFVKEKVLENSLVTIDTQDEEFIRRLIEQSDFEFRSEEMKKRSDNEISVYDQDNNKSFKAALDMPLLEFGASELAKLVENTSNTSSQERSILTDNIVYNDATNNENSDYVSVDGTNSSVENNLHFTNQSTTEIFNKLLDIRPDNNILNEIGSEFLATVDLAKSAFDESRMEENSTMCEPKNLTRKEVEKEVCKLNSGIDTQEIENTSSVQQSSFTSLDVHLDNTNSAMDVSLKSKSISDEDSGKLELNLEESINGETTADLGNKSPLCLTNHEKQYDSELQNSKIVNTKLDKTQVNTKIFTKDKENEANSVSIDVVEKSSSYCINIDNVEENNFKSNSTDYKIESKDTQQPDAKDDSTEIILKKSHEKYKDNVVFSVSKISLSDDENIFATDSDVSSGRSYDFNERISMEKEKESLEDSAEKVYQVFNLYNSGEEKLQNFEANVEQELATTSKNLECNDEVKITKSGIGETSVADLTPLELDSKLQGALDFDEDFDDALSLTTSCFASPNDERFEESIVDFETKDQPEASKELQQTSIEFNPSQVKDLKHFKIPKLSSNDECFQDSTLGFEPGDQPETPEEPQQTIIESNPLQAKNAKHFKIPKLNNATDLSSAEILNKPEPEEINFCNTSTEKSSAQPSLLNNSEKITRTIKNNLVQHLNEDTSKMPAWNDFENETITKVFGITCLPYLVGKCFDLTHCQLSHHLNSIDQVYQSLNTLDKLHASVAYKILYNHLKLFAAYFKQFCSYYTNKNDRIKLLNMVNDCERYPEYAELIIDIYEGLVKCGLSRVNACRLVLKRIRETSISASIVETLIAMIMKSGWVMFTDFIEKYTQDMYQFNFRIGILEQMAPEILNSKSPHLKQVFGKCVQTLHRDDTALLLNSPILIQCVALLTTNT